MRDRSYLAIALFGAVAVLTLGITPPYASATPSAPTELSPDGTSVASNPVLGWKHVRGAESYRVKVSSTPDFSSLLWSTDQTANRYATPTTTLPAGTIHWRVRASDDGAQSPWANASFDVDALGGPALLSPADGASLPQPQIPPQLSWSGVRAANSYEVEVGLDPGLVGATTYTTKTTSYLFTSPQAPNTWYWRVRALRSAGRATEWSEVRSYTVEPIAQPTDPSPANSPDTLVSDVVLGWDAVDGAQKYEVRVSTDRNFSTIAASATTYGNHWSPATTLDNDQYWWQVRALDVAGRTSPWPTWPERTWQFERRWQFGSDPSPVRPELLHPTGGVTPSVQDPFFYQWEPVRLASRYRLQMGTDENFSPDTYDECSTHETTLTPRWHKTGTNRDCNPSPGGTFYWRVQGVDEAGEVLTPWSDVQVFTYRPGGVTVTAPADGAAVAVPTMRWEPEDGAEKYKVTWTYEGATTKSEITYSTSYTPDLRIPVGKEATWSVQAINVNGDISAFPIGGQRTFTTIANPTTPGATPVLDPPETGAMRFPALSWSPVEGADYYKLRVGHAGTGIFTALAQEHAYPAGTDITESFIRAGDWDYMVTAYTAGNSAISTSGVGTFSVEPLSGVSGERLALSGLELGTADECTESLPQLCRSLTQTPVLDWDPVEGASHYLVYVARDESLTNMIYEDYLTKNTRWTPTDQLPDSQAGQAYYWVVRACKSKNACAPDPTQATHAFDKVSNPVELTSPTEGETVSDAVTFEWRDYLRTNVEGDDELIHTTVEAASYRIEVANNSQFSSPYTFTVVDQTTFTAANRLYPEGPLYWRVAAIDGTGHQLPWSNVVAVNKTSSPVVLQSPTDDGVTTGSLALRWQSQPFVGSYQVEVYKNNDENFSTANRVLSATSKMPALSVVEPLPASPTPYVWRVRKVDGYGNVGAWSSRDGDVWSFRVRSKAPRLVSPADAVYVAPNAALFTWKPVPGASLYRYERRLAGSSSSSETINTPALAWAPSVYLSDGGREWRVSAIDTDGNVIGSSPWRTFKVDGTAPTVVKKFPASGGKPTTNVVATLSEAVRGVDSGTMKLFLKGRQHPVSAQVSWDGGSKKATLNPNNPLQAGKTYKVTLSNAIADPAGNNLAATSWEFRVRR